MEKKKNGHLCSPSYKKMETESFPPAVDYCFEGEDGFLYASNGEYVNVVNFCPFCGFESKQKRTA